MEKVIQTLEKNAAGQRRINVIKMEIDYELYTLFDAMEAGDQGQMDKSKEILVKLREEWVFWKENIRPR